MEILSEREHEKNFTAREAQFDVTLVHFRSFEDDLVDDQQWANKDALLAQTGLALLAQPIQDHLDALKGQYEFLWSL